MIFFFMHMKLVDDFISGCSTWSLSLRIYLKLDLEL